MRRLMPLALALAILALVGSPAGTVFAAFTVYPTTDGANVRTAPSLSAPIATTVDTGDNVIVTGTVTGASVNGTRTWYRTKSGWYISAAVVSTSPSAAGGAGGRSIDVNLSTLTASAIENGRVVYTAPIVSGKPGWETPTGNFRVLRRAGTVTMRSASFGVGPGDPEYYVQPDVPYTQFFDNAGDALHGNYWSPSNAFGNYNTSHGCVGMRIGDAAFFWNFGRVGMPVNIHY